MWQHMFSMPVMRTVWRRELESRYITHLLKKRSLFDHFLKTVQIFSHWRLVYVKNSARCTLRGHRTAVCISGQVCTFPTIPRPCFWLPLCPQFKIRQFICYSNLVVQSPVVLLLLSVGLPVTNAPDALQPCGLLYYPWCSNSHHQSSSRDPGSQRWS